MKSLRGKVANLAKQGGESPVSTPTSTPVMRTTEEEVERLKEQLAEAHCQISTLTQHAMNYPVVSSPTYGQQALQQGWTNQSSQQRVFNSQARMHPRVTKNQQTNGQEGQLPYRALCFLCGEPGHYKRNCPQYNSQSLPLNGREYCQQQKFQGQERSPISNSRVAGTTTAGRAPVYLKVKVRHRPRLCLLDTGSDTTLIPLRLVGSHNIYRTDQKCIAANGSNIPIIGSTSIPGQIGKKRIMITGLVSEHILDLMLGVDWLQENNITWDFNKAEVNLEGETFKLRARRTSQCYCRRVVLSDDVTVPARSQLDVSAKTVFDDLGSTEDNSSGSWGTEALEIQKGLLVARTLLPNRLKNLPVRLLNTTDESIQLEKDTAVSPLVPLVAASVQVQQSDDVKDSVTEESIISDLISGVDASITEETKQSLKEILQKYSTVFSKGEWDLGWTDIVTHSIDTGDSKPFRQPMRRYPPAHLKAIDEHLQEMLQQGVITPTSSPWASNVVLAKKKDGTYRCCIDFRQLNNMTKKDAYPLPRTDACLDALSGCCLFSTFDMRCGFHQVSMKEEDSDKTAFITRRGMFKFLTMPFGLCNAVATSQRLVDLVLSGLNLSICLAYLDDIVLFSKTPEEHLLRLELLLQRLKQANLKLKPSKCQLLQTEISFLGHRVSGRGVSTEPAKIQLIKDWPVPKNLKELRGFLGLTGYYRKFVQDYSMVVLPLNALMKKNQTFEWTDECQAAFEDLKEKMQKPPILALPNETDTFVLDTDAAENSIGSVLSQR